MAQPILLCDTKGMSNERWLECRMHGPTGTIPYTVGGSDVATIFGLSPWTTPLELWLIKKGRMKPVEKANASQLEMGHLLEPIAAHWYAKKSGNTVYEDTGLYQHADHPYALANFDRRFTRSSDGEPGILECKSCTYHKAEDWADDAIPIYYELQLRFYLSVADVRIGAFSALWGNNPETDLAIPDIERDQAKEDTLTIKGTGNYTGTATAEWKIIPAKLTVSVPSEVKKEYDGTTNATVTPTFNGLRGKDNLTAADYSVTAAFDNAKVGYKKTVIGKVTLNQTETAKNYVLTNDGNFSTDDGTITKAVAPTVQPVELTIYNGVQADYYVDLPSLPDMGKGKSYGTVGYRKTHTINLSEGYKAQSDLRADPENLNTLRLLLHMTQTSSLTGEIGTVTIPVTTSNYQDITLTVKISAKNRITPTGTPTLSKNAIIYGDALNTIALSGKLHDNVNNVDVDGTFEWVDGTHKFEVHQEIPKNQYVLANVARIREVLVNLLGNAVKFTKDGGKITLDISSYPGADEKHIITRYVVRDNGIGMSEEYQKKLFDPFSQEDDANARTQYKGTGLGMAITKKYVDMMGGSISVESKKGVGSTFTVEIPLELTEQVMQSEQKQHLHRDLTGIHVLMAEDNDLNAELATIMLEDAGMTVTRASDGKEVVDLFKNHPRGTYDLILMDIMMPNMDGHQAAKAIRALGIERSDAVTIPIIALSANAFIDDIQESLDLGMNAHISKPINMEELIDTITKYKQSIPQSNHSV